MFLNCKWFSNFSVLCEFCCWKLLVRCKTLIYCGQLCNNAVNYPSTPLSGDSPCKVVRSWLTVCVNPVAYRRHPTVTENTLTNGIPDHVQNLAPEIMDEK
jgi:hypothetical protein